MRFSVACRTQNALFRRVRLSSPAQTSACLTEKRILYLPPHGKAHSVSTASRKSTFCTHHDRRVHFSVRTRSQNAPFLTCANIGLPHGKAHSVPTTSRKSTFCTHHLTEKRILARRNRRAKACVPVICLPRSGWSWAGGYANMPTRSWPDKQNRSTLTAPQGYGVR